MIDAKTCTTFDGQGETSYLQSNKTKNRVYSRNITLMNDLDSDKKSSTIFQKKSIKNS